MGDEAAVEGVLAAVPVDGVPVDGVPLVVGETTPVVVPLPDIADGTGVPLLAPVVEAAVNENGTELVVVAMPVGVRVPIKGEKNQTRILSKRSTQKKTHTTYLLF